MAETFHNRANTEFVIKLDDEGKMPSQIAVEANISLNEVLDVLEKKRKQEKIEEKEL